MNSFKVIAACLVTISLTGCSYITKTTGLQSQDNQYLKAKSIAPLRIPPGISSDSFENKYPVSDRQYPEAAKSVSLIPPGLMDG